MAVAPSNPITPQSYTYLGDAEMVYLEDRICSLCGATINNFRVAHPIMRYDPARPYYHRVGSDRGWKDAKRIGWSCGKHRTIAKNWLPQGLDTSYDGSYNSAMISNREVKGLLFENWAKEFMQIRNKLGLSRAKMAALFGVDASTIWGWETTRRSIPEMAIKLARMILSNAEAGRNV